MVDALLGVLVVNAGIYVFLRILRRWFQPLVQSGSPGYYLVLLPVGFAAWFDHDLFYLPVFVAAGLVMITIAARRVVDEATGKRMPDTVGAPAKGREVSWRRMLRFGALLSFGVAAVVAAGVIPRVKADTFPFATPDTAVPAFWGVVMADVLVGAALLSTALMTRRGRRVRPVLIVAAGFVGRLLGLGMLDAALAFTGHGPAMRGPMIALFVCVGAELAVGATVVAAMILRRRSPALE
jgi:hypothetical protein